MQEWSVIWYTTKANMLPETVLKKNQPPVGKLTFKDLHIGEVYVVFQNKWSFRAFKSDQDAVDYYSFDVVGTYEKAEHPVTQGAVLLLLDVLDFGAGVNCHKADEADTMVEQRRTHLSPIGKFLSRDTVVYFPINYLAMSLESAIDDVYI